MVATTAIVLLTIIALPGTTFGQGSNGAGPGLSTVSEVLGRTVEAPAAAPSAPAAPPASVAAAPPAPAAPTVSEMLGRTVEALVRLPVSAPAVVAPPVLEEIAGRSIALPTDEVFAMAVAPRLTERVGPGLSTARVLPKAGDPTPQPNGVWVPLVLTVAALGFGVLGVVWPRQRRKPTP